MKIKVVLADDHPIVTEGMKHLLSAQEHLEVIATYATGAQLLEGLKSQQPDVLLLDIQFPDIRGTELIREIIPEYPDIRILILSSVDNLSDIRYMMQNGCAGYMLKNIAFPLLLEAIKKVYDGEEFIDPSLEELILAAGNKQEKILLPPQLTQRELKILKLIAEGHTSRQIAAMLFLSHRTIQNNRQVLYQKFGVHNTAELIKESMNQGIIKG